jgi:hypothetical protein
MNYKDLKNRAEARKIMIKDIAEQLDMTPNGFKVSIETEKFPIGKVRDLCDILQISIAEFFGETTEGTAFVAAERVPYGDRSTNGEVAQLYARIAELKEDKAFLQAQLSALTGAATKKVKSA